MTDDDLDAMGRHCGPADGTTHWVGCETTHPRCAVAALLAEVRRLRAAVAWHEKELAAEREVALAFEEIEQKLLADRGIRREPKSTPAVTLAAEVDRLRAAVAGGWWGPLVPPGDGGAVVSDSDRGPATADGRPWKGV